MNEAAAGVHGDVAWRYWFPDECAGAGSDHTMPGAAARYDERYGFDPTADVELVSGYGLGSGATVVDLGAGTGTFALAAAERCARVVAVDPSPEMVRALRERVKERGVDNVDVVQAGFLGYAHIGAPADVVYSRNALHHLPDVWQVVALRRVAGLLAPSGVLRLRDIAYAWEPDGFVSGIDAWLRSVPPSCTSVVDRGDACSHVRREHSSFAWLLEAKLARVGFETVRADASTSGVFATYVCRLARRP